MTFINIRYNNNFFTKIKLNTILMLSDNKKLTSRFGNDYVNQNDQRKSDLYNRFHQRNQGIIFCVILTGILLCFNSCKDQNQTDTTSFTTNKIIAPISIEGLRNRTYKADLKFEKKLDGSKKIDADLYSCFSDSLKIYALVNTPKTEMPKEGFPILIFGHGFHPEPKKYGLSNKTGEDWRPGDYYRGIPEAYAEKGFLAITPDYRGHNVSDGFEFTKTSYLASTYYAIDVLHVIDALSSLKNVDLKNVFYMGHSMGGDVGLKMLLATDKIKAASIWAGVSATTWEQAIYYGKWNDENWDSISPKSMKEYTSRVDSVVKNLNFEYDIDSGDPVHFIQDLSMPLILHHATKDTSVPYRWSESLAAKLFANEKEFEFYSYESEHHLFKDENRKKAVERDIVFFNKHCRISNSVFLER
ncbi:MAG: dienelactone hydrolase [Polaribacter sp.]|jgi:dienelactone hydrolase